MSKYRLLLAFFSLIGLISGCGRPHDPESVLPPDISGGYKITARIITPGNAQDVIVDDTLAYIAQGEGGMIIINVKDIQKPEILKMVTEGVRGYSSRIVKYDSVVYIAAGSYGVTVINVANPLEPIVTVSNLNMKPAKNLYVFGQYLFTAIGELGVKIAELSYPTQPDIRGGVSTMGYANGITITADSSHMFVANGQMGISMFNIRDFQEGYGEYPLSGWIDTPGYAEAVVLAPDRSVAFLACGSAGLQIIDYSDTTRFTIAGTFYHSGYAKALHFHNNLVYLAARKGGLQIIDVSNLSKPSLVAKINTTDAMGLDVKFISGKAIIYVADDQEGLIIITQP